MKSFWKWRMIIAVNFPIWAIGKKKPEKIRASTGFEPVTSAIPVRCSTNWAMMPHIGSEVNLLSSCLPWRVKWREVYMKSFYYTLLPLYSHQNDYIAIQIYCSTALHVTVSVSNQANIKISNKYEARGCRKLRKILPSFQCPTLGQVYFYYPNKQRPWVCLIAGSCHHVTLPMLSLTPSMANAIPLNFPVGLFYLKEFSDVFFLLNM